MPRLVAAVAACLLVTGCVGYAGDLYRTIPADCAGINAEIQALEKRTHTVHTLRSAKELGIGAVAAAGALGAIAPAFLWLVPAAQFASEIQAPTDEARIGVLAAEARARPGCVITPRED